MLELIASPALSLVLCLLLTPIVRMLASRWGLVDRPDGRRKLHSRAIPLGGGLAVLCASAGALVIAAALWGLPPELDGKEHTHLYGLLLASVILCVAGLADDVGWLRGRHKLLGQMVAVGVVMSFGVYIQSIHLFGRQLELGLLSLPFTMFVLLGAINSLNLIDGMDGLLCSLGFILCLAFGGMALSNGRVETACVAFSLAGALLGFLFYNLPPASIYLGDSGSMIIGLTVGVLAIQSSLKGPATVALAAPTALLAIPIFDTTAAILRRMLTGRSIYSTDRAHLHHCLLRRGLSARTVLLIISGCCLVTMGGALLSVMLKNEFVALLSAVAVVTMLITTRLFGHAEMHLVLRRLQTLLPSLPFSAREPRARQIEVRLQGSLDWRELWLQILTRAPSLNLRRVRFDINAPVIHESYHARWDLRHDHTEDEELWEAAIPVTLQGRTIGLLVASGSRDAEPVWQKIATLTNLVETYEPVGHSLSWNGWHGETSRDLPVVGHSRPEATPHALVALADGSQNGNKLESRNGENHA
jgi:UDP-GlcNAc:undecaprenyl-phosphate GlcNAc-1-phosphate transferase